MVFNEAYFIKIRLISGKTKVFFLVVDFCIYESIKYYYYYYTTNIIIIIIVLFILLLF